MTPYENAGSYLLSALTLGEGLLAGAGTLGAGLESAAPFESPLFESPLLLVFHAADEPLP